MNTRALKTDLGPPPESKRGRTYKYPFDTLEVGESFVVFPMKRNTLSAYVRYAEQHLPGNRKFVTKSMVYEGHNAVGVWRTK